jgi:hypothetical protein
MRALFLRTKYEAKAAMEEGKDAHHERRTYLVLRACVALAA